MIGRLRDGSFPLGRCHQFVIFDPKERIITAPCFEERVLHHAIMNVCEPHFERWLIHDSYACRKGKGRIAALLRARQFAGRYKFFLKLDVRKYFDSISHDRIRDRLHRGFKDRRLLDLFGRIIDSYRDNLGRGLPIGSLTSQHFANLYLGDFDRFIKQTLRMKGYVRYMDDVAIWADDSAELRDVEMSAREFLRVQLGLEVKADPYRNRTRHGMDYLGCRVFPKHMVLNHRSKIRFRRQMRKLERAYLAEEIDEAELQRRGTAMVAFTRTAGLSSWKLRQSVLSRLPVSGHEVRTG